METAGANYQTIIEMINNGFSYREVGLMFDVSKQRVHQIYKYNTCGCDRKRKVRVKRGEIRTKFLKFKEDIIKQAEAGLSLAKIHKNNAELSSSTSYHWFYLLCKEFGIQPTKVGEEVKKIKAREYFKKDNTRKKERTRRNLAEFNNIHIPDLDD